MADIAFQQRVKMLQNVNVARCCFESYEDFELSQAAKIGGGKRRFEVGQFYDLKYERAEDWLIAGFCDYVY